MGPRATFLMAPGDADSADRWTTLEQQGVKFSCAFIHACPPP